MGSFSMGASDRHEAPLLEWLLVGTFTGSRRDELVAVAFDRDATAEAPVFRTKPYESSALLAKMRYRLKRLGIRIDQSSIDSTPAGEVWQPTAAAVHR